MRCCVCLSSTRVYGQCVVCVGVPTHDTRDPVLRWFLDVLSRQPDHTLSDEDCALIRIAVTGTLTPEHALRRAAYEQTGIRGGHIGTIGDRHRFIAACVGVKHIGDHPDYGPRFLITFREAGTEYLICWFTGSGGKFDPREHNTYTFVASVKEHTIYDGECQTIIQRPKEE